MLIISSNCSVFLHKQGFGGLCPHPNSCRAQVPVFGGHRSEPPKTFVASLLSSHFDAATFCPIDQRAKSLSYKASTQFLRSCFLTSKTPLTDNEITGNATQVLGDSDLWSPRTGHLSAEAIGFGHSPTNSNLSGWTELLSLFNFYPSAPIWVSTTVIFSCSGLKVTFG